VSKTLNGRLFLTHPLDPVIPAAKLTCKTQRQQGISHALASNLSIYVNGQANPIVTRDRMNGD